MSSDDLGMLDFDPKASRARRNTGVYSSIPQDQGMNQGYRPELGGYNTLINNPPNQFPNPNYPGMHTAPVINASTNYNNPPVQFPNPNYPGTYNPPPNNTPANYNNPPNPNYPGANNAPPSNTVTHYNNPPVQYPNPIYPGAHNTPTNFNTPPGQYPNYHPNPAPPHPHPTYPPPNSSESKISSQLALIETISNHLDSKKICISANKSEIIEKFNSVLRKIQNYQQYIEVFTRLKSKFKCEICLSRDPQLSFRCGHNLCGFCFCNRLGATIVPPSYDDPPIKCFVCQMQLEHEDYSYFFHDWGERLKAHDVDKRRRSRDVIECKGCLRKLHFTCFAGCKCLCFECQLNKKSLGYCECGEAFNSVISCDLCKKKIVTPYMNPFTILCIGHIFCEACTPQLFEEFICKICKRHLVNSDIRKLSNLCLRQCFYCQKTYSSKYFISSSCCRASICIGCQYRADKSYCAYCRVKFDFSVEDYMESFNLIRQS